MRLSALARGACVAAVLSHGAMAQGSDTAAVTFNAGSVRVIHQKRTVSNTVAATLFLLGGARQIDSRTAGVEPLILLAAGLGSTKYPGSMTQVALAETGASITIEAGEDWTTYTLHADRSSFDRAWSVFADRVQQPTLLDQAINDATRRMLADLVVSNTDPDYVLNQIARPIAFANHPYANDPRGTDRSLRLMRSSTVRDYHRTQFIASRMLLVVVGNIDRADVERLAASSLGTMNPGSYVWTLPPPVPQRKTSMTIIPRQLATDYIIGIFPGPLENTRDYGAFRLGTGLLGAYLNYEIREKQQLSYAAGAPFFSNAASAGAIYASTQRPERVMELMVKQIEDAGGNQLPFQLIPRFVSQFEIESLMSRETNEGQARALGRAFLIYGDLASTDGGFRSLRGVSAGSLRSAVARSVPSIQWLFMGDTSRFRKYMR